MSDIVQEQTIEATPENVFHALTQSGPESPGLSKPGMNGRSLSGAGWEGKPFHADTISVLALLLNISFSCLAADMARCRERVGRCPECGQVPQMGKLLAQEA
jgi:hypothetical protein